MNGNINKKKMLYIAAAVAILLLVIKGCATSQKKQDKDRAHSEIMAEYELYCNELPDKLRAEMSLGDNVTITSERHSNSTTLADGSLLLFYYNDVTLTFRNVNNFSNMTGEGKYNYMHEVMKDARRADYAIEDGYYYLSMSDNKRKELSGRSYSFTTNLHIEVCDGGTYSLWSSVNVLYKGNEKIYDPNAENSNESSQDSGSSYRPSGNEIYNGMMTDPDDYDDPDDFAEDAWGVDFDDYDEAYEYWENW